MFGPILDPFTRVYIIFHGDNGDSEKIYLNPQDGEELESEREYTMMMECPDIGRVRMLPFNMPRPFNLTAFLSYPLLCVGSVYEIVIFSLLFLCLFVCSL